MLAYAVVDVIDRLVEEVGRTELDREHVGMKRGRYLDMMTAVLQTGCGDVGRQDRQIWQRSTWRSLLRIDVSRRRYRGSRWRVRRVRLSRLVDLGHRARCLRSCINSGRVVAGINELEKETEDRSAYAE